MVNFSENSDLRRGFKASLRDFWDKDFFFQEEQQKAIDMFLEGNDVSVSLPTGNGKSLIYQAAPGVIDGLSPPKETGHYIYCAAP